MGIVLVVIIGETNKLKTNLILVNQDRNNFNLSIVKDFQVKELSGRFKDCIVIIKNKSNTYLKTWSPFSFINNKYIKAILNKLGIKFRSKRAQAIYLNHMRCEAHRNLSKAIIENELQKSDI